MKDEHYVQVQRRKSLKYGDKQRYQDYITIPAELSRLLGLQPSQVMKCSVSSKGALTYAKAEKKPNNKMVYEEWISIVRKVTPVVSEVGKSYQQICKEGGIPLRSAPALWVKQAETDIGLIRKLNARTHRVLWTKAPPICGSHPNLGAAKPTSPHRFLTDWIEEDALRYNGDRQT